MLPVHHHPECCGAHGVTNIYQSTLPCVFGNIEEHGRKVILPHLIPGEPPELLLVRVHVCMIPAVDISSEVTQPHIIASISKKIPCLCTVYNKAFHSPFMIVKK